MSLFSRKPKIALEEFCRDFYENMILNPVVGSVDGGTVYRDYVKESITEVDSRFAGVDIQKLADELIVLRFELFALAWIHKFGCKSAIAQSIFTKRFLQEKERKDIWERMESYNKAISSATTAGLNQTDEAFIVRLRADLADKYIEVAKKDGFEIDESMGRPINRYYSENAWKNGNTAYFLILMLWGELGFTSDYIEPNEEALLRLTVFIRGLYDGAQQSWDNVKIIKDEPAIGA